MIKHTQAIRRILLTNCQRVFDPFVGLAPYSKTLISLRIFHQKLNTQRKAKMRLHYYIRFNINLQIKF